MNHRHAARPRPQRQSINVMTVAVSNTIAPQTRMNV